MIMRWSWEDIFMKGSFQSQIFASMGRHLQKKIKRAALCSFNDENIHATDLATFLDQQRGVAIRSGHHCTQPLHRYLGVNASARASLYFYNTKEDVDNFIQALNDTVNFFSSFK
ncbi:hypothetical protein S245_039757 [Arachis hypogaea]